MRVLITSQGHAPDAQRVFPVWIDLDYAWVNYTFGRAADLRYFLRGLPNWAMDTSRATSLSTRGVFR